MVDRVLDEPTTAFVVDMLDEWHEKLGRALELQRSRPDLAGSHSWADLIEPLAGLASIDLRQADAANRRMRDAAVLFLSHPPRTLEPDVGDRDEDAASMDEQRVRELEAENATLRTVLSMIGAMSDTALARLSDGSDENVGDVLRDVGIRL